MILLFVFILISLGCAGLGGWVTAQSIKSWYPTLIKPRWNPPDKIFGPVWITLYLTMAVSAWLVCQKLSWSWRHEAMILFSLQLLLNIAWSFFFFGLRRPDLAFVDIVFLWVSILLTTISFWKVYWLSGALFVPYFLWVSFAVILNAVIARNNSESIAKS